MAGGFAVLLAFHANHVQLFVVRATMAKHCLPGRRRTTYLEEEAVRSYVTPLAARS